MEPGRAKMYTCGPTVYRLAHIGNLRAYLTADWLPILASMRRLLALVAGLGVPGAWAAAVMDINSRALLMFLRFRQGRWKRIKV